jgi:hypothetical protein
MPVRRCKPQGVIDAPAIRNRMSEADVGAFLGKECKAHPVPEVTKIVGLRSRRGRIISWDHRKLSGVY